MTIAVSVPTWTMTSKSSPTWPKLGIHISAAERCPSEETGMNSVNPWINPSSAAWSHVIAGARYHPPYADDAKTNHTTLAARTKPVSATSSGRMKRRAMTATSDAATASHGLQSQTYHPVTPPHAPKYRRVATANTTVPAAA